MQIEYANGSLTSDEVVRYLALTGEAPDVFEEVIRHRELLKKAEELGIEVSDTEIQRFADNFRISQYLHTKQEMDDFLNIFGLSEDDFTEFCEMCLLRTAVKERMTDDGRVDAYFEAHRADYDRARIAVNLLESLELAEEVLAMVRDGREDFFSLAREHSLCVTTKYAGGRVGLLTRGRLKKILTPAIAQEIFDATPGDVVGPYREHDTYRVILVEELRKARMSPRVRSDIKEHMMVDWSRRFVNDGIRVVP